MIQELHDYLRKKLSRRIYDWLEAYQSVHEGAFLTACIVLSYDWLGEHTLGAEESVEDMTIEELVESIRSTCGLEEDAVQRTGMTSWTITLPRTIWSVYRPVVLKGHPEKTRIRLAHGLIRGLELKPNGKTPEILEYVDSLVPEFTLLIQEQTLEARKRLLANKIDRIATAARKQKRSKK